MTLPLNRFVLLCFIFFLLEEITYRHSHSEWKSRLSNILFHSLTFRCYWIFNSNICKANFVFKIQMFELLTILRHGIRSERIRVPKRALSWCAILNGYGCVNLIFYFLSDSIISIWACIENLLRKMKIENSIKLKKEAKQSSNKQIMHSAIHYTPTYFCYLSQWKFICIWSLSP